jgi:hypothetical protein
MVRVANTKLKSIAPEFQETPIDETWPIFSA